jgi:periplasmic divalent cation tolerance protein
MTAQFVFITAPPSAATHIARHLVEGGFAACVNVLPGLTSVYRWQGQVCEDAETLLIAKTATDRFEALRAAVLAVHPYELPEVMAVNAADVHPPYLQWLLHASSSRFLPSA